MVISTDAACTGGKVIARATVASPARGLRRASAASTYSPASKAPPHSTAGSRTAGTVSPNSSQLPRISHATSGPLL